MWGEVGWGGAAEEKEERVFTAVAIVAWVIGAVGLVMLLALFVAGMPNSTPKPLRRIKRLMLATAVAGAAALAASAWLLVEGRALWAAGVGLAPATGALGLTVWAGLRQ